MNEKQKSQQKKSFRVKNANDRRWNCDKFWQKSFSREDNQWDWSWLIMIEGEWLAFSSFDECNLRAMGQKVHEQNCLLNAKILFQSHKT